jgi:hypothetical protein
VVEEVGWSGFLVFVVLGAVFSDSFCNVRSF